MDQLIRPIGTDVGDIAVASRAESESAAWIRSLAEGMIDAFRGTIGPDGSYRSRIYQSARSVSEHIAGDYGSRFLIELVQNAYDALAEGEAGRIRVVWRRGEGRHGILYVANSGVPFQRPNVRSLCDIGLSEKPPGQAIGNKGLGFRSISYVTDEPSVFSGLSLDRPGRYTGHCFRFATAEDLADLLPDPIHLEKARRDLPRFHVPIPLDTQGRQVRSLAEEGLVTCIALPVRDDAGAAAVESEIAALRTGYAPVHLFLSKLASLEVEVEGSPLSSFALTRDSRPVSLLRQRDGDRAEIVDLGTDGTYFVLTAAVPESRVKDSIGKSIAANQIHSSWQDWRGDGEVALAFRLDGGVQPTLYTHLPMAPTAQAPVWGHLHASFFARVDRRGIDPEIPVNRLYLEEAVDLAARALVGSAQALPVDGPLPQPHLRSVLPDLISWTDVSSNGKTVIAAIDRLRAGVAALGDDLVSLRVIPAVESSAVPAWSSIDQVWSWSRPAGSLFAPERVSEVAAAHLLDAAIGDDRIDRLCTLVRRVGCAIEPPPDTRAGWAEAVAHDLNRKRTKLDVWRQYYRELAEVLERNGPALLGREVLLCADGKLRRTQAPPPGGPTASVGSAPAHARQRRKRIDISVFLPPRSRKAGGEVVEVPVDLQRGLAFLDGRLGWYTDEMQAARSFLERAKLVRDYDADELIAQVSRAIHQRQSKRAFAQALTWVHRLYRLAKQNQRPLSLRRASLLVPTVSGEWIPAKRACFGEGWPDETLGSSLHRLLRQTVARSVRLQQYSENLIAPPDTAPFRAHERAAWTEFLSDLGVRRGLFPEAGRQLPSYLPGRRIDAKILGEHLVLSSSACEIWAEATRHVDRPSGYGSSHHELDGTLWILPGQDEHDSWPDDTRLLYAELVLHWLPRAEVGHWSVHFSSQAARHRSRFEWPTPVAAFVRNATWLPMRGDPSDPGSLRFVSPAEVWLDGAREEDRVPAFLISPHRRVARLFDALPVAVAALEEHANLRRWNDLESLPEQVEHLARQFSRGQIHPADEPALLRTYRDTWRRLAETGRPLVWPQDAEDHILLLEVAGQVAVYSLAAGHGAAGGPRMHDAVWVRDQAHCLALDLMQALGRPVFDSDPDVAPRVAELLEPVLGPRLRRLSAMTTQVVVDGRPLDDLAEASTPLRNICGPIDIVVMVAAASMSGVAARSLPTDHRRLVSLLDLVGVIVGRGIGFEIEGMDVGLPDGSHGILLVWDAGRPYVLIRPEREDIGWGDLARASGAFAEVIRQAPMEHALRAAFRVLERFGTPLSSSTPDVGVRTAWAIELGIAFHEVDRAILSLGSVVPKVAQMLRPVVCYWGGEEEVEQLDAATPEVDSIGALIAWVAMQLNAPVSADAIVDAALRAGSFAEVRDELKLDFRRFNESLIAVGERPEQYPAVHRMVFDSYRTEHFRELADRLRAPFDRLFRLCQPLIGYSAVLQQWNLLSPPEEWLDQYAEPPQEVVRTWIDGWLTTHGCPDVGAGFTAGPIDEVRRTNKRNVERFAARAAPVVRVWSHARGADLHRLWTDSASCAEQLGGYLYSAGVLDFEVLTDEEIMKRLRTLEVWPTEMPLSLDPSDLGLDLTQIGGEEARRREEREHRERERRLLDFGERTIDPEEFDVHEIASFLASRTQQLATLDRLGHEAAIRAALTRPGGGGGDTRGPGGPVKYERIHPRKAELIGLIGEIAVYQWLKEQFPNRNVDEAWVSANRAHLLTGPGDDGLGYDFRLQFRDKTWFIEVKTHVADPLEIDLGETQVRQASECARVKGKEFLVLYVSNAGDPSSLRIEQLPNPLAGDATSRYRLVGEGLRYRFTRS